MSQACASIADAGPWAWAFRAWLAVRLRKGDPRLLAAVGFVLVCAGLTQILHLSCSARLHGHGAPCLPATERLAETRDLVLPLAIASTVFFELIAPAFTLRHPRHTDETHEC